MNVTRSARVTARSDEHERARTHAPQLRDQNVHRHLHLRWFEAIRLRTSRAIPCRWKVLSRPLALARVAIIGVLLAARQLWSATPRVNNNKILDKMLERLYASLTAGPVMNCRPHSSRQRIDLTQLARLDGSTPASIVAGLLGADREVRLVGRERESNDRHKEWLEQQALLGKLRTIAEDAKTYEQDTGAQVLFLGLPILNLPPDARGGKRIGTTKRILAPIAFVPVTLSVKTNRPQSVTLACAGDGAELVIPNAALVAWVEQRTGKKLELFTDESGADPWREIIELSTAVSEALGLEGALAFGPDVDVVAMPRADDDEAREPAILPSAVLGLYPVTNQNLLRDLEALADGEPVRGPIQSFLSVGIGLGRPDATEDRTLPARLVSWADPCQSRAVRLARESTGLVVHGPPGTGKSQTITNIIGDHLARGERVLFVCDKRTALDVVFHRLSSAGFGNLCAIVHDAQRDQRDLYKSVREQLDGLPESKSNAGATAELRALDEEAATLHAKLREHHAALSARPNGGEAPSLHELTGRWFALSTPAELDVVNEVRGISLGELPALERHCREVLERSRVDGYPTNVWCDALGLDLATYLAKPVDAWRRAVSALHDGARACDACVDPRILPFGEGDATRQGAARTALYDRLKPLAERLGSGAVAYWSTMSTKQPSALANAASALADTRPQLELLAGKSDSELGLALRSKTPPIAEIVLWLGQLASYLAIAKKWYGFLFFGRKRLAREVLQRFGLAASTQTAERVSAFLQRVRARAVVEDCYERVLAPGSRASALGTDEALVERMHDHRALLDVLRSLDGDRAIRDALSDAGRHEALLEGLRLSATRGRAIADATGLATSSGLFSARFLFDFDRSLRLGEPVLPMIAALEHAFGNVDGILRIRRALAEVPPAVRDVLGKLAERKASADAGWSAVQKAILAGEIHARIEANPSLNEMDSERLRSYHERVTAIEGRKRDVVVQTVQHQWIARQRARLLASTGSRLNGAGADLARRLVLRGQRAMRLRQVIAAGAETEGGDPLFDLRPVWMASPETVAQIFPRKEIFDVVIFDEASQCRLEEALPVLTRARRVVIAGDPKQLPPTRFFESTVTQSRDDELDTSEQGLFEDQQADTEDLLGAALNLEIEQCYLDVHYRSQNADLIEFSNRSFYDSRLQAIPGHPRNRSAVPPLRLVRVEGVYDKRANAPEVAKVVEIVRELLGRPNPPSIGIACFNLVQRDAIVEALDDAAADDATFGERLATARKRQGTASFEGLFVKNLENVQGDERDHMIISTTYGPDAQGRFYRRFGPLAMSGGGRRLNVLVTRARQEVHLVTSIPRDVYTSLPDVAPGATPNGAYLLFSYLQYAEKLEKVYADEAERRSQAKVKDKGTVVVRQAGVPSTLAEAIARRLANEHGLSSDVHWGNDGFCVDVALHHPIVPEDVTIGVLFDNTRFEKTDDPVEWDLFRTNILAGQGWKFVRVWSPQFVREPQRSVERITQAAAAEVDPKLARVAARRAEPAPAVN